MSGLETTMTQKGQVTIPAEIRARLGLKPKDKVQFELKEGTVTIRPVPSRIRRHFGAVTAPGERLDWRAEREAFEEGVAEDVVAEDR